MIDDDILEEIRRRQQQKEISAATGAAVKGGGITGALLGAAKGALTPGGGVGGLIRNAAIGGVSGAGLAGLGTYLGSQVEGPGSGERGAYAKRAGLGGALMGGLGGLGLGALLGSGKLGHLISKVPKAGPWIVKEAESLGTSPAGRFVKSQMSSPSLSKTRTAAALGILGGVGGGLYGSSEGMGVDFLDPDEEDPRSPWD